MVRPKSIPPEAMRSAVFAALGEMMMVMGEDRRSANGPVIGAITRILPAIDAGQFAIARETKKMGPEGKEVVWPTAFVVYARIDDARHLEFMSATKAPELPASAWRSGQNIWLIDTFGDMKAVQSLITRLYDEHFEGKSFHAFVPQEGGKLVARTFTRP